uniref:aminotransferase class V-fold PLP-dependent enzyme n=1 Tax=Arthrobacter sp. TB 23 TaxID=494419 RepID=UPI000563745B
VGAAALAHAAEVLASLDEDAWLTHEQALRSALTSGLETLPGVTVHQLFPDSADPIGVVNFSVSGYDAGLVAAYLSAEHGVGLRDGKFCAHPLLKRLGLPSGSLRASVGLGSQPADVERLLSGLRSLLADGLTADYVVDEERWVPAAETRTFPVWAPHTPGTAGAAPCSRD